MWNHRKWRKGRTDLSWQHKGVVYFMVDQAEFEQFKKDPGRYAPRFLGCDAVILDESNRVVRGDIKYGAYFDGRLYLFATYDTRRRFKLNPGRYAKLRQALRIDQIERRPLRLGQVESNSTSQ